MIRTIYLIHHSHMDIGYTDLASEVRDQHLHHLDEVLEIWKRSRRDSTATEFKWTCESAWVIKEYMQMRSRQQVQLLLDALKSGAIELMAFFAQPLTELSSFEESIESVRFAAELGRQHNFPVRCAMLNDVGGYMGRLPTVLEGWDIRYLVAGVGSYQVHMPWASLPHLFYLQDRAGHKTLIWNLGIDRNKTPQSMKALDAVYYMGGTYLMTQFASDVLKRVSTDEAPGVEVLRFADVSIALQALLHRLEAEKYPYEQVLLQYAADNVGPDPNLPMLVDLFNALPDLPKVILTTPGVFFEHMVREQGASIPVLKGAITDPWNLRTNPQPQPLARKRCAQFLLAAAEARNAHGVSLGEKPEDCTIIERAYENLHYFTDHTCGLSEWGWQRQFLGNCRASTFDRYRLSWRDKSYYADSAMEIASHLDRVARERILSRNVGSDTSIIVWNDLPRTCGGIVSLWLENTRAAYVKGIRDGETGKDVQFQRISSREFLLGIPEVPPLGYRVLIPEWTHEMEGSSARYADARESKQSPFVLESETLKLALDRTTGQLRSLRTKADDREWLDPHSAYGCGQLVYTRLRGIEESSTACGMAAQASREFVSSNLRGIRWGMQGPLRQSIVIEREYHSSDGIIRAEEEIILPSDGCRVDFRIRLDKPETAAKESCYVAFPLNVPDAHFRYDQTVGWVEPAKELLPGSMQDCFLVHRWADISNETLGATLICPDAPVIQVGRIRTYEWKTTLPFAEEGSHLYGWPYHNLQQTDNPIWQDVLQTFRYSLLIHGDSPFDAAICDMEADKACSPLRAHLIPYNSSAEMSMAFLELQPPSVRLASCRVINSGEGFLLRLEERDGKPTSASLKCPTGTSQIRVFSDFTLRNGRSISPKGEYLTVELAPFEVKNLLVSFARGIGGTVAK